MTAMAPAEARDALRACVLAAYLALAQEFFSFTTPDGRRGVPLDQAHVFASRRTDCWERWEEMPASVHGLCGRLWQVARDEGSLAQREVFFEAVLETAVESSALFRLPEGASVSEVRWLEVQHAQEPLALARQLASEAEEYRAVLDAPFPMATPGTWFFGPDNACTAVIPATEKHAPTPVVALKTAAYVERVCLPRAQVLEHVQEQAAAHPSRFGWKPRLLKGFFDSLTDAFGRQVGELILPAGALTLLNAPTGVGKSVLMRDAARILTRTGQGPVLVVVGRISESMNAAEHLAADDLLVQETAASLEAQAHQEGRRLRITAWVAHSRKHDQAVQALTQERYDRFDQLAVGCEMAGWQVDGPALDSARPPCDRLRWAGDPSPQVSPGRHTCPRMAICERYEHVRQAAEADVIVTNHHNLVRGRCKVPVEVDGKLVVRDMSVMEFVLRRCRVVIVDEIDAFQRTWCDMGAREFVLSTRGGRSSGRLEEVDRQRNKLSSLSNLPVTPPLMEARKLSDSFLDNVLAGRLWLEASQERGGRPSSGWYVPGMRDADMCRALVGAAPDAEITDDTYQAYLSLFPDRSRSGLPEAWEPLADQLAAAVDMRGRSRKLTIIQHEMKRILRAPEIGVPSSVAVDLVNDLLVRAWLGSLQKALNDLKWAVMPLIAQLPAASDLAKTLGGLTDDDPLPYRRGPPPGRAPVARASRGASGETRKERPPARARPPGRQFVQPRLGVRLRYRDGVQTPRMGRCRRTQERTDTAEQPCHTARSRAGDHR